MSDTHDRFIRPRLMARLAPSASWMCEEFSADCKADVATIEGDELRGHEIKAARDTLTRLGGESAQVEMYSRVFDRVVLVCAERHVARVVASVPAWWGVTVATADDFVTAREPALNPVDPTPRIMRILWATEAMALLRSRGLHRGVPPSGSMARHGEIMRRVETLSRDDVRAAVFAALARRDWGTVRKRKPTVAGRVVKEGTADGMVDFMKLAEDSLRRERWVDGLRAALAPSGVQVRSATPARDDNGLYWQVCMVLPTDALCVVQAPVPKGAESTSDATREDVVRRVLTWLAAGTPGPYGQKVVPI